MPTQSTASSPGQYGAYGSSAAVRRPSWLVSSAAKAAVPGLASYWPPENGYPSALLGAHSMALPGASPRLAAPGGQPVGGRRDHAEGCDVGDGVLTPRVPGAVHLVGEADERGHAAR